MAAKNSDGKSMDIQKPGSSPPDSTAKPIIVTNRPILQDPMVVSDPSPETGEETAPKKPETTSLASSQKIIMPTKSAKPDEKVEEPPVEKEKEEEKPAIEAPSPNVKDSMPSPGEEAAVVGAIVASSGKTDDVKKEETVQDADEKRKQQARTLADSKKYIVPIGQVTKARQNRQAVWLLVFLVAGIAGYAAVRFKFVTVPFNLP